MKTPFKVAATIVLFGLLAMPARSQEPVATSDMTALVNGYERAAHSSFVGVPTDWSSRHLIFSQPAPGSDAEDAVQQDPRYWQQQIRRGQLRADESIDEAQGLGGSADGKAKKKKKQKKSKIKKDWSQTLGATGAKVGAGFFPAKYTYGTSSATCSDYVAFNTSLAASATQASVISFSNLYTTGCSGTVPTIEWAYNTGGTVVTSLTPSSDGTQVAFVQSVGTTANLVLLKWNAGPASHNVTLTLNSTTAIVATTGTFSAADVGAQITATGIPAGDTIAAVTNTTHAILATAATTGGTGHAGTVHAETAVLPGTPPTVSNAAYRACTAPCMTTIAFNGSPNDTNSSPYYVVSGTDADVIFTGDDSGHLHKFTGVFAGTPAEVTTGGFPVTAAIEKLSGPVYNSTAGTVEINASYDGTNNGARLHEVTVDSGTPVVTDSEILGPTTSGGINCAGTTVTTGTALTLDAPIVDATAGTKGTVYVFIGNDGVATPNSAVYQFATGFAEHTCGNKVVVGTGSTTTGTPIYSGSFDALYFNSADPSPSGNLYVCGNAGGDPTLYRIPIASNAFGAVSTGPVLTTGAAVCSPLTEFENGATDRAFVSVTANGKTATPIFCPAPAAGCLMSFTLSTTTPTGTSATIAESGGTSGIVVDNAAATAGASQIYLSTLTGANAVQAAQSGL